MVPLLSFPLTCIKFWLAPQWENYDRQPLPRPPIAKGSLALFIEVAGCGFIIVIFLGTTTFGTVVTSRLTLMAS